jgi:sugar phosphate permease
MSNWFPKKNRGFLVGLWSSCGNLGNIIGSLLAAALINVYHQKWGYLLLTAAFFTSLASIATFFFLIPEPEKIGITIEEETFEE